ncbi:hypothetical protein FRC07_006262 [Ceratobasidium sp. 392]|nr:hypothetical protein FRC07_006262 [Ceratobasidium sp. 392]
MDAFSKLRVDQVEKRKALWAPVTESPFPPKHLTSGMRFAFGNPIASEEPAGLRDALASATEELALPPPSAQLASDTDMENITHAIIDKDVIMANTQSSAPVTQQNTALEPLGVTAEETGQKLRATLADFNAPVMSVPFVEPALSVLDPAAPANSAIACDSAAHTTSIAPAPAPVAPVAPAAPVAPVVPSHLSHPLRPLRPPHPLRPLLRMIPLRPDTPQKSAGRKQAAPKSNEPDAGSRRVSARHAAVQDDDTQARQTRAGSKRVKETVVGKGTQRKSKGRR